MKRSLAILAFISVCGAGAFAFDSTTALTATSTSPLGVTSGASSVRYDEAVKLAAEDIVLFVQSNGQKSSVALNEAFRSFDLVAPDQAGLSEIEKAQLMLSHIVIQ